jgi:hypothetical protein
MRLKRKMCKEESIKMGFTPYDKTVHTAAARKAVDAVCFVLRRRFQHLPYAL